MAIIDSETSECKDDGCFHDLKIIEFHQKAQDTIKRCEAKLAKLGDIIQEKDKMLIRQIQRVNKLERALREIETWANNPDSFTTKQKAFERIAQHAESAIGRAANKMLIYDIGWAYHGSELSACVSAESEERAIELMGFTKEESEIEVTLVGESLIGELVIAQESL